MNEDKILYESGDYWIARSSDLNFRWQGFAIMKNDITHSKLVGIVAWPSEMGFKRAKDELNRLKKRDDELTKEK